MSIADDIRNAPDQTYASVKVREWGGLEVRLKSWNAGDRCDFDAETSFLEENIEADDRSRLLWARAVARSVVNEDGSLAFACPTIKQLRDATKEGGDLTAALKVYIDLSGKNAKGLIRLFRIVSDLNALTEEDEAEIEKN